MLFAEGNDNPRRFPMAITYPRPESFGTQIILVSFVRCSVPRIASHSLAGGDRDETLRKTSLYDFRHLQSGFDGNPSGTLLAVNLIPDTWPREKPQNHTPAAIVPPALARLWPTVPKEKPAPV